MTATTFERASLTLIFALMLLTVANIPRVQQALANNVALEPLWDCAYSKSASN
jgi:hypothetical protein